MPAANPAPSSATPAAPHVRRSWRTLFDDQREAEALARLWVAGADDRGSPPVTLHPRALAGAGVLCRPGTTDAQVFDDTFVGLYHLPPADHPLSADAVIVDLGANVGYTAAHFAAMLPESRIIAVEMDAENFGALRANVQTFGDRCRVVHAAVWDADGEISYSGTEEWGFRVATLEGQTPTPEGDRITRAEAISMPTLMRRCGIERIDYLKVDIEGAEAAVIDERADWLAHVGLIKIEYHPPATAGSMQRILERAGFTVRADDRHTRCLVGFRP